MKRAFVLLFLLFSLSALYSLDGDFGISLGFLGIDFNTDMKDINSHIYGRFLNFIYQSDSGLGLAISPFIFSLGYDFADDAPQVFTDWSITFLNASIFYNLLKSSETLIFGPFAAVSALKYGNPSSFEFRSGLTFSVRSLDYLYASRDNIFFIDIIDIELGYKYNKNDRHEFFVNIGFDLVSVLWLFSNLKQDDYNNYMKEHTPGSF